MFTKKLNLLSGAAEWVLQDDDYDFHQEIARSAFADMLHDSERVSYLEDSFKTSYFHGSQYSLSYPI